MLHRARVEIQWNGAFKVCFRSGSCEPWTSSEIRFYEAEETIMFLVGSLFLPPEKVARAVLDAIAKGKSASQRIVCSDQQLQSIFGPRL